MFSGCTVLHDSKEAELSSSNHEASPSVSKNTCVVLVPCLTGKYVPIAISGGVDISEVPGCHSGFYLMACDPYFMILVEVFMKHISEENIFHKSYRVRLWS